MNHRNASVALACCLLALTASPNALSKTLYVETFGTSNGVCSKAAPCEDLQDTVVNVAGNNDRIVVGPGTFSAGAGGLTITQSGLKLTSVARCPGNDNFPVGQRRGHHSHSTQGHYRSAPQGLYHAARVDRRIGHLCPKR